MPAKLTRVVMPPNHYPSCFSEALYHALLKYEAWATVMTFRTKAEAMRMQKRAFTFAHSYKEFPFYEPAITEVLRFRRIASRVTILRDQLCWALQIRLVTTIKDMEFVEVSDSKND
jgi:hypothetical protein